MSNTTINLSSNNKSMSRVRNSTTNRTVGGESFTLTCYTCGMPSSKEWAQRVQSHSSGSEAAYYPFLLQISHPPHGAYIYEDGSTFLCAFCHASLEYQWNNYEKLSSSPNPKERHYNLQDFICSVCSVQTYRKRVRALPFQEFPFLAKERPVGSLTLGNNPLAIVCLDCSETLWAQSAEYDRWGLPIQKRHFNWMQRPPPPENSMEATVARLPSGETQLPRCPPTEPEVLPRRKTSNVPLSDLNILPLPCQTNRSNNHRTASESSSSSSGTTNTNNKSPMHHSSASANQSHYHHHHHQSHRKTSGSSTGSSNESVVSNNIPVPSSSVPVVTVAPMSVPITTTTSSSQRKGSLPSYPTHFVPGLHKYSPNNGQQSLDQFGRGAVGHLIFPDSNSGGAGNQTALNFAGYPWSDPVGHGCRDSLDQLRYPFGTSSVDVGSHWPWLPPPTDLLRYQAYLSSLTSRSLPPLESYYPGHIYSTSIPTTSNASFPIYSQASLIHPEHSLSINSSAIPDIGHYQSPKNSPSSPITFSKPHTETYSSRESREKIKPHKELVQHTKRNSLTKLNQVPKTIGKFYTNPKKGLTKNNALSLLAEKSNSTRKPSSTETPITTLISTNLNKNISNSNRRASEPAILFGQGNGKSPKARSSLITSCMSEEPSLSKSSEAIMDLSSSSTAASSTIASPKKRKSFMIAYLCGEDISPNLSVSAKQEPETEVETEEQESSNIITLEDTDITSPGSQKPKIIENEEEFIAKALEEYQQKRIEQESKAAKDFEQKKNFLGLLNLITTTEKSELEMDNLVKRAEKKSLPPILVIPPEAVAATESNKNDAFNDEFDKKLFMTCFQEKFNPPTDPKMIAFLKGLNLKPTTKSEKYRREQEWRIIFSERIHRERRGSEICGKKRPWNYDDHDPDKLTSFLNISAPVNYGNGMSKRRHSVPPVNSSSPLMRSLSVSLPPNKYESCSSILHHSTDLLRTVPTMGSNPEHCNRKEPVISYPKYVPSYATAGNTENNSTSAPETNEKQEKPILPSILNVPVIQKSDENGRNRANTICIPKVPVINLDSTGRKKIPFESSLGRTVIGNSNQNRNGYSTNVQWPGVDGIIQNCGSQWKETKEDIEYLIKTGSSIKSNEKLKKLVLSDMRKLRKALSSQQLEMKALVKKLKDT